MNALANPFAEPKIQTDQNNSEPELQRYQQWQLLSGFLACWAEANGSWRKHIDFGDTMMLIGWTMVQYDGAGYFWMVLRGL